MRTTLNLNDRLLKAAKVAAAERGVTLTKVIEDALRAELAPRPKATGFRLELPVVVDARPPRVDVSDRDALYALMEESESDADRE